MRRKQELEAITFKLPVTLKREIEELRGKAESAGFDLAETITAAVWRLCKQIKAELNGGALRGRKLQNRVNDPANGKLQ
ncbi:MAG: hypothetical protein ACREQD_10340 [Candidatus Binataceae bacterium]